MADKSPPATPPRYWFPAKTYGWGWGMPITWQGWLVFLAALGLFACGAFLFRRRNRWPCTSSMKPSSPARSSACAG